MPIRKALSVDGESKAVNYLLCGEYEMTNTSWSKLQKKYKLSKNKIYSALKGKRRPRGSQYWQKRPFLQGFQSVSNYLDNLWTDVNNPSYFWHSFIPFAHVLIDPTINDSHIEDLLKSLACHHCPYSCQVKMKFE